MYKLLINCISYLFIEYIPSVVFWFMFYDRCYSFSVWIWILLILNLCFHQKELRLLDFANSALSWMKWHLLFWFAKLRDKDMKAKIQERLWRPPYMGFLVSLGDAKRWYPGPVLSQWKVRALDLHGYKEKEKKEKPRTWGYDHWSGSRSLNIWQWVGWMKLISFQIAAGTQTEPWWA